MKHRISEWPNQDMESSNWLKHSLLIATHSAVTYQTGLHNHVTVPYIWRINVHLRFLFFYQMPIARRFVQQASFPWLPVPVFFRHWEPRPSLWLQQRSQPLSLGFSAPATARFSFYAPAIAEKPHLFSLLPSVFTPCLCIKTNPPS